MQAGGQSDNGYIRRVLSINAAVTRLWIGLRFVAHPALTAKPHGRPMHGQRQPIDNRRYAASGIPIILPFRPAGGWIDGSIYIHTYCTDLGPCCLTDDEGGCRLIVVVTNG
jgi:hypothetical protein